MREELARDVFAVLRQGLAYREQLRQGKPLSVEGVQVDLKAKLILPADKTDDEYLGARFALVCWLDEIFIIDSPWTAEWRARALEPALYTHRERHHRFWEQAELAARRSDADVLEVYYLCALLGFRGDLRGEPARLAEWREKFEKGFGLRRNAAWPEMPPKMQEPEADVWALRAKDRLRWLLLALSIVIGGLIVLVATLTVWRTHGG